MPVHSNSHHDQLPSTSRGALLSHLIVIIQPIHTRIGRMRTARSIDLNLLFRLLLKGQK